MAVSKPKFKTCAEQFAAAGIEYEPKYICYNIDIPAGCELCPFAKKDTCSSEELP